MKPTVLLTGAGGFVIGHLAAALAARGARLVLVDRHFDAEARRRVPPEARLVACAANALDAHVDEPVDVVVHGAAVTAAPDEAGWSPEAYYEHEIGSALAVWRWAAAAGVRRCVFISSAAVFSGDEAAVLDETVAPRPTSHYGRAKLLIEGVLDGLRDGEGRDACSARLGDVYGPGERARPSRPRVSLLQRMLDAAERGVVESTVPSRMRSWSYAPDVAAALGQLIAAPRLGHGLYHLTSAEGLDERGLAAAVARRYPAARHREVPVAEAPPIRGRFAGTRFAREFPGHAWTPLAAALPQLRGRPAEGCRGVA
jgi:nucleoside-diphosphate-sugar epimerase